MNEGTLLYSLCIRACEEAGFTPGVSYTSHRIENIIDLVSKNMGIGLLMQKQAAYYANNADIRILPVEPELTTHIDLAIEKATICPLSQSISYPVSISAENEHWQIEHTQIYSIYSLCDFI